jgi:excisionase family DNA binding protein
VYIQTCEMTPDVLAAFDASEARFREPSRICLLDYATPVARLATSMVLGPAQRATDVIRPNQKGDIATGDPASIWPKRNVRRVHSDPEAPSEAASSGNLFTPELSISDATSSLPDRIEQFCHALTAVELAELLAVSRITVFKLAKAGRIPCFRIGTCVRFDPRAVANWLRRM